jgi:hypothetical protein
MRVHDVRAEPAHLRRQCSQSAGIIGDSNAAAEPGNAINRQAGRTQINEVSLLRADRPGIKALLKQIGGESAHQGNGLHGRPSDIHPRDDPHHPESFASIRHPRPPINAPSV